MKKISFHNFRYAYCLERAHCHNLNHRFGCFTFSFIRLALFCFAFSFPQPLVDLGKRETESISERCNIILIPIDIALELLLENTVLRKTHSRLLSLWLHHRFDRIVVGQLS